MSGTSKGSLVSDFIVIGLFVLFLAWGGYHAFQAVATLSGVDVSKIEDSLDTGKWQKAIQDKINGLIGSAQKKPTPPVAQTVPGGGPKTPAKKAEVKAVKIFEAGKEIPAVKARVYATQFSPQARQIYAEISYTNNNYQIADASVPLVIQYLGPSGQLLTEMKVTAQPKKEWASAIYTRGWGPETGGAWAPGTYTIKVSLDGESGGEFKFEIR